MPSASPDGWRSLLGDPVKHWRTGYSARSIAQSWEAACGLPEEARLVLEEAFGPPELLLANYQNPVTLAKPQAARTCQTCQDPVASNFYCLFSVLML